MYKMTKTEPPNFETFRQLSNLVRWSSQNPDKAVEKGLGIIGFGLILILLAALFSE